MYLTKKKLYHFTFYVLIILLVLFNGGNYDLYSIFNFILVGCFFIFCNMNANYRAHLKYFFLKNNKILLFYFLFLFYLAFQLLPLPLNLLKFFSPMKYAILLEMNYQDINSAISLDPIKTFYIFLNFFSLILFFVIFKSIFYKKKHLVNFYFFLTFSGFFASVIGIFFFLIGNPDIFILTNSSYKNASTGFFINRTVFSCFLVLTFLSGLEFIKIIDNLKNKIKDIFFKKIYLRFFLIFITIGVITSLSRLGNFLLICLIIFYLLDQILIKNKKNNFLIITLFLIIVFDIFILGFYFGGFELIDRFAF